MTLINQPSSLQLTALDVAYQKTLYQIFSEGGAIRIRINVVSAELTQLLQASGQTTWAFITAFNPYSQRLERSENLRHNRLLAEAIEQRGLAFLNAEGRDPSGLWPVEESFFILGITQADAVALGKQFCQNAILYGEIGEPAKLLWISRPDGR